MIQSADRTWLEGIVFNNTNDMLAYVEFSTSDYYIRNYLRETQVLFLTEEGVLIPADVIQNDHVCNGEQKITIRSKGYDSVTIDIEITHGAKEAPEDVVAVVDEETGNRIYIDASGSTASTH